MQRISNKNTHALKQNKKIQHLPLLNPHITSENETQPTFFPSVSILTPSLEYFAPTGATWFGKILKYFLFSASICRVSNISIGSVMALLYQSRSLEYCYDSWTRTQKKFNDIYSCRFKVQGVRLESIGGFDGGGTMGKFHLQLCSVAWAVKSFCFRAASRDRKARHSIN